MPITINGSGTVTGISAGGLPDASVLTADIADANITAAKLSGAQTGSAPVFGCRAWVNFDGTGTTGTNMTIRASGNVASVYKNGSGDYTITFTTAMPDANYATVAMGNGQNSDGNNSYATYLYNNSSRTASVVRIICRENGGATIDVLAVSLAIFR
jgi:hypothetical protein